MTTRKPKGLLSEEEQVHATMHGWRPGHVFDQSTNKWRVMLFDPENKLSPYSVGLNVVRRAKTGDKVAIKSLKLMMGT